MRISMTTTHIVVLSIAAFVLTSRPITAQTAEDRGVITLSSQELGPFRPEERPDVKDVEEMMVKQTNAFRKQHDLQPLRTDQLLGKTASEFASYMARTDRYGHHADGRSPAQRARKNEYPLCLIAENIAYFFATEGFQTKELASDAVDGWIESPPHRRNMLKEHVSEIGVAVAQSEQTGVFYVVQLFGRRQSEAIRFEVANSTDQSATYMLGDQSHTLPPGYTSTHEVCAPQSLSLKSQDEGGSVQQPRDGDRFVIRQRDSGLALQAETDDRSE